jgi:hypothetical protein
MALNHDRDFIDVEEEAEARQAALRVSLIGILAVLLLGIGLVGLLMYGRILTDNGVVELTAPPAVTVPQAPVSPQPRTP